MARLKAKAKHVFSSGTTPWDPTHRFETSWLLSPWVLFGARALMSLYAFATLLFVIAYTCAHPSLGSCPAAGRSFSYFTVLTYWGLAFYFLAAAVHTARYALSLRRGRAPRPLPRPLQALHSLLYTTVVTLPFVVTAVYWAVLYRRPWFPLGYDAWRNLSQHALNAAFALFEVVFARTEPPPWVHVLCLVGILLAYLGVAYLTVATQGWYTYRFLDHDALGGRGYVAAYVFGIAAGGVAVFAVVRGLICLRRSLTEGNMGRGDVVEGEGGTCGRGALSGCGGQEREGPCSVVVTTDIYPWEQGPPEGYREHGLTDAAAS